MRTNTQQLKCNKCNSLYHPICVNVELRKLSEDLKLQWTCPPCHSSQEKNDINTQNAQVRYIYNNGESYAHQPVISSIQMDVSPSQNPAPKPEQASLVFIASEMKLLREYVLEIKTEMKSLTEHITHCNARLDEYEIKLNRAEGKIQSLESSSLYIKNLENTVSQLQQQVNHLTQESLKNVIEISGINETPNENTFHIVHVLAQKLNIRLEDQDLDYVSRTGHQRQLNDTVEATGNRLPRALLIRFLRREKRNEF